MISALLLAAISFVVNPEDPALRYDGYKVERSGEDDYVITGRRARSELYARYDEPLWRAVLKEPPPLTQGAVASAPPVFIRNPAFETRFLNVNPSPKHGLRDYVAATGCNLVQLGRMYGVSLEETMPEVFAAMSEADQEAHRKGRRQTQKSGAVRVKALAEMDVPAYPLLYGCDAMKWDKALCEAFLKVYPDAKGTDPGHSWEKGVLCPSEPATAKFIESFVYEMVSNAPYEGLVATFWDDYGLNCQCAKCRKNGNRNFSRQVAFAVGCYERACAKAGRKLIVRTWSSGAPHWLGEEWVHAPGYAGKADATNLWGKTYSQLDPKTIIQTKVYNSDCQPNPPFSNLLGEAAKTNVEIAEWQITGQTLGLQWLPASVVDDTKARILKARELVGPRGGVALYAGGYSNPGYDQLDDVMNSINIYAWRELSWNPDKDVNAIWKEWAVPRFGGAAEAVIDALKLSEKPVTVSFSPLGFGASTESGFANYMKRREDLLRYTNRQYDPEQRRLLEPTAENIAKVDAEKDAALAAVSEMKAKIAALPDDLPAKAEMVIRAQWLETHLKVSRALDDALWRCHRVQALAMQCTGDRDELKAIREDFDVIRREHKNLFKVDPEFQFSFYPDKAGAHKISLGSPVPLMRDIDTIAKETTERILGR